MSRVRASRWWPITAVAALLEGEVTPGERDLVLGSAPIALLGMAPWDE